MAQSSLQLKDHWQEQTAVPVADHRGRDRSCCCLSGLLVTRLVQLQILDYERFSRAVAGQSFPHRAAAAEPRAHLRPQRPRDRREPAELGARGDRRADRRSRSHACARSRSSSLVDPSEHNNLRDLVRSHRGFERVKLSNLTEEQAATFAVRRHLFSGVDIQEALSRYYPFGEATRARDRLRRQHQPGRSRAHRPQQLRGHVAHRQDRASSAPTRTGCTGKSAIGSRS